MELGTIEREIFVEASPETVFEVVSSPEHVREWWPDDAAYDVVPGANGQITFGDPAAGGGVVGLTVLEVDRRGRSPSGGRRRRGRRGWRGTRCSSPSR